MAHHYHFKKGMTVYSNINLNFPFVKITREDLLDYANKKDMFKNSFFLIDEFAIFIGDARRSHSHRNVLLSYFIVMTRKLGIVLALCSQTWNMIEKRVRENTDIFVFCKSYKIEGGVTLIKNELEASNGKKSTLYFEGNDYFDLYDTYEIVDFKDSPEKE